MHLNDLQSQIDQWISQFKEGYFPPLSNLARLTEEVGELARALNHHFGPKVPKPDESMGNIEEELGDIVFTVAVMANSLDIDLDEVMQNTLDKVRKRDQTRWSAKDPSTP